MLWSVPGRRSGVSQYQKLLMGVWSRVTLWNFPWAKATTASHACVPPSLPSTTSNINSVTSTDGFSPLSVVNELPVHLSLIHI